VRPSARLRALCRGAKHRTHPNTPQLIARRESPGVGPVRMKWSVSVWVSRRGRSGTKRRRAFGTRPPHSIALSRWAGVPCTPHGYMAGAASPGQSRDASPIPSFLSRHSARAPGLGARVWSAVFSTPLCCRRLKRRIESGGVPCGREIAAVQSPAAPDKSRRGGQVLAPILGASADCFHLRRTLGPHLRNLWPIENSAARLSEILHEERRDKVLHLM
jgi:hypothetical protein